MDIMKQEIIGELKEEILKTKNAILKSHDKIVKLLIDIRDELTMFSRSCIDVTKTNLKTMKRELKI